MTISQFQLLCRVIGGALLTLAMLPGLPAAQDAAKDYEPEAALSFSQAAVGREIGGWEFIDARGKAVNLSRYAGRPLLISMIFTSCHMVCPAITHHLDVAVQDARKALGNDSFQVITVGFDTPVDTPEAMRLFARRQGIEDPNWAFLSGSPENVRGLMEQVGFVYFPSPRGFDHINQVTVIDRDGVVYRQVYGAAFDLPWLVEPLKELVFNRPQPNEHFALGLLNRIKLFCTVYDPNTGRYRFDYSLFVGMAIGGILILAVIGWLLSERAKKRKAEGSPGSA